MTVSYVPLSYIPYVVIWTYNNLLWLSEPLLLIAEVVLALNFVMHCSRRCAEKVDEDEDDAWKWKILLTGFSAFCYALVAVLVTTIFKEDSNMHFWLVLLVLLFSVMLAAHNMMWMSHEGIVSDVAFVTLCSVFIMYMMKEEVSMFHAPLAKPDTWYSLKTKDSLYDEAYRFLHTSLGNAHMAIAYLKRFVSPLFILLLGVRLYSIMYLIQRFIKNFSLETDEECLEDIISWPWHSPLIVKCAIVFMFTQLTTRLIYQSSGISVLSPWIDHFLAKMFTPDFLLGRMLQIVVVNCFYIWRLYCADSWQWNAWFSV